MLLSLVNRFSDVSRLGSPRRKRWNLHSDSRQGVIRIAVGWRSAKQIKSPRLRRSRMQIGVLRTGKGMRKRFFSFGGYHGGKVSAAAVRTLYPPDTKGRAPNPDRTLETRGTLELMQPCVSIPRCPKLTKDKSDWQPCDFERLNHYAHVTTGSALAERANILFNCFQLLQSS